MELSKSSGHSDISSREDVNLKKRTMVHEKSHKENYDTSVSNNKRDDFVFEKMKSVSFDWTEFEKVFASEFNTKVGFERLVSFLSEVSKIIARYLKSERQVSSKIVDFHHPHQLREMMDHCLNVDDHPRDLEQVLSDCKETLKYCVKTAHPRFLNQLSTGLDVIGMTAEWVTAAANTNMFTYEIAPVFTLMEEIVLGRMLSMIGWENGDGIFSPGGATSNLYAMMAARHVTNPDIKVHGMASGKHYAVYTSEQSHFSIKKAAIILGIGLENVFSISTDMRGKMNVSELEETIQRHLADGVTPVMVNATCGTTVLGAFDPVNDLADVCQKYGVWLHIDGAWGGSVLFSAKHKHLLSGLERADSMTWNPHKMMGVPLQCSAIFMKKKGILSGMNELDATYLYQKDKIYDTLCDRGDKTQTPGVLSGMNELGATYLYQKDKIYDTAYDTGDKAIQCGRHNDVFKLWLMWRSKGDIGFSRQIDRNFEMSRYLRDKLKRRDDFELVLTEIEGPNVCFWYVPEKIKHMKSARDRAFNLHKVTAKLKALMMEKGSVMIQYQPMSELPNFFRVAFSNPITTEDVDVVINEITQLLYGAGVTAKLKALMMEKGSVMIQYQPMGELPNFFRVAFSNPIITTEDVDFVINEIDRLGHELE